MWHACAWRAPHICAGIALCVRRVHMCMHMWWWWGKGGRVLRRAAGPRYLLTWGAGEDLVRVGVVTIVPFRNSDFYRLFRRTLYEYVRKSCIERERPKPPVIF